MIQCKLIMGWIKNEQPVLRKSPEESLVTYEITQLNGQVMNFWKNEKENDQACIIQWKNPENSSCIKMSQVIFLSEGIQQDVGYQKARQNKKDVHGEPSKE